MGATAAGRGGRVGALLGPPPRDPVRSSSGQALKVEAVLPSVEDGPAATASLGFGRRFRFPAAIPSLRPSCAAVRVGHLEPSLLIKPSCCDMRASGGGWLFGFFRDEVVGAHWSPSNTTGCCRMIMGQTSGC